MLEICGNLRSQRKKQLSNPEFIFHYKFNVSFGSMYHFVNDLSSFNIDKSYKQI